MSDCFFRSGNHGSFEYDLQYGSHVTVDKPSLWPTTHRSKLLTLKLCTAKKSQWDMNIHTSIKSQRFKRIHFFFPLDFSLFPYLPLKSVFP